MERLSQGIESAVADGSWRPVKFGRHGHPLTHIFFADDLVLFCEASIAQIQTVLNVLKDFCVCSGQKINKAKTAFCVSKNVQADLVDRIRSLTGFRVTENLGHYLGIPVLHSRMGAHFFRGLEEKVRNRLSSWKANTFSLAGRVTLVKSVIMAIPSYTMQMLVIPAGTCDRIEAMCRNLIWGDSASAKKVHLIHFHKFCQPKDFGGIGLKRLRSSNLAYMAKLCWRFIHEPNAIWVRVLSGKSNFRDGQPVCQSNSSVIWKAICRQWKFIHENVRWSIGDGSTARFWFDHWLGDQPLILQAISVPEDVVNWRVREACEVD